MAACWYGIARTAVIDRAAAWAEIDDGGSAKIVTGVQIGEHFTVLAQIAAQIGVRRGRPSATTTPALAGSRHAGASARPVIGNVVALAFREARKL
jgi:hypothetical protein